jgi:hypothetical protein
VTLGFLQVTEVRAQGPPYKISYKSLQPFSIPSSLATNALGKVATPTQP